MLKQQIALLSTEGVELEFTDAAVHEISKYAEEANTLIDNIGARRLYTIIERIVEEISFTAPEEVMYLSIIIFHMLYFQAAFRTIQAHHLSS